MDDPCVVSHGEGVEDLRGDEDHPPLRDGRLTLHRVGERLALDVLHHDPRAAVLLSTEVEDANDVGVVEGGGRHGLPAKPLPEVGVPAQLLVDDLDGYLGAGPLVGGGPDGPHPAGLEALLEPISPSDDGVLKGCIHGRAPRLPVCSSWPHG